MWDTKSVDIGKVLVGSKNKITFKYKGSIDLPKDDDGNYMFTTSCGCSKPSWNPETQVLNIEFVAGDIPRHLIKRGYYVTAPYVVFPARVEGQLQSERLEFRAEVHVKL